MKKYCLTLLLWGMLGGAAGCLFAVDGFAFPAAGVNPDNTNVQKIEAVRATIFSWINTWRNRDINNYLSYYSLKFENRNSDYLGWQKKKSRLFQQHGQISIQIRDLCVFVEGGRARASFIQRYQDANHADVGEKILELVYRNGTWQIVSEDWKPLKGDAQALGPPLELE